MLLNFVLQKVKGAAVQITESLLPCQGMTITAPSKTDVAPLRQQGISYDGILDRTGTESPHVRGSETAEKNGGLYRGRVVNGA